jgi:L-fuculose-phosphate aldolase
MKSKPDPVHLLVDVCHRLYEKGFVTATDGNISIRTVRGTFLTTCTLINKGDVKAEHIIEVDETGNVIRGKYHPSTELKMHLLIYKHRRDINAVVHAHPPYATGFAVARMPIPRNVLPEVIVNIGQIPIAEYATPGTSDLANSLVPHILHSDVILLTNHGVVTCGKDLWDAYYKMEKVEHAAKIIVVARMLGGEKTLSGKDVKELLKVKLKQ